MNLVLEDLPSSELPDQRGFGPGLREPRPGALPILILEPPSLQEVREGTPQCPVRDQAAQHHRGLETREAE